MPQFPHGGVDRPSPRGTQWHPVAVRCRFGRKAMLMWSYLQLGVMGTCTAFAPNYASYCVFRFAGGMALSGVGLSIACLGEGTAMTTGTWVGTTGVARDGDIAVAMHRMTPWAWTEMSQWPWMGTTPWAWMEMSQ